MNQVIRQCYKGIAYCYYHPEDKKKSEILNSLILRAWYLGFPKVSFDIPTPHIAIGDMTKWEIGYSLKDVIDIDDYSWYSRYVLC